MLFLLKQEHGDRFKALVIILITSLPRFPQTPGFRNLNFRATAYPSRPPLTILRSVIKPWRWCYGGYFYRTCPEIMHLNPRDTAKDGLSM